MPRKETRGSGITARPVIVYDLLDPADSAEYARLQAAMPSFRQWLDDTEIRTRAWLQKQNMSPDAHWLKLRAEFKFEEDSQAGFAGRILETIRLLRAAMAKDDVHEIADRGVQLGTLITQSQMKYRYEPAAMRGVKVRTGLVESAQRGNRKRRAEAAARHRRWQTWADKIWQREPNLSRPKVADEIVENHDQTAKVPTVRKHIKKGGDNAGKAR